MGLRGEEPEKNKKSYFSNKCETIWEHNKRSRISESIRIAATDEKNFWNDLIFWKYSSCPETFANALEIHIKIYLLPYKWHHCKFSQRGTNLLQSQSENFVRETGNGLENEYGDWLILFQSFSGFLNRVSS